MMASRMTMMKKKKEMSNRMRQTCKEVRALSHMFLTPTVTITKFIYSTSLASPSGGSISSPMPPPALTPLYRWNTKHCNRTGRTCQIFFSPDGHFFAHENY